ncbi:MAG: FAD-binding oxidoreductase [Nocardioidaceae bacterium]|nr:FAD-binding oxidoreductase [Nocardioidaceae bacterium]NUS52320.1 FAD-binding oxidoreductase [Nocardioidaceae bacterium]
MSRVIVVGAGVVGLSCAVRLLEAGHSVHVVARDLPLETTSAVAAAIWYPYRAFPFERVTAWSGACYRELERLAEVDDTGVLMRTGTELHRARTADPWWREAVPALTRVRAVGPPYVDGWSFVAPVVEMPVYLRWLVGRIEELGGTLTRMALSALPDRAEVVVNASGLGARRMAEDMSVTPVRGQVVYVEQVGLDRWWLASDANGSPIYVVPRSNDIVVGGTDDEGEWDRRPDPDVAKLVLERAIEVVPALARAAVLGHKVGLRPARPEVRLEAEDTGTTRVVHCYGHGGAGVTLSWGCADDVAALVGA